MLVVLGAVRPDRDRTEKKKLPNTTFKRRLEAVLNRCLVNKKPPIGRAIHLKVRKKNGDVVTTFCSRLMAGRKRTTDTRRLGKGSGASDGHEDREEIIWKEGESQNYDVMYLASKRTVQVVLAGTCKTSSRK